MPFGLDDALGVIGGISQLSGLFGGNGAKSAAKRQMSLASDATSSELGYAESLRGMLPDWLRQKAKDLGFNYSESAPDLTGGKAYGYLPSKFAQATPHLTDNAQWNPLNTSEYQNARAGMTAQGDAQKQALMAQLAARNGAGTVAKGNSAFNINQNLANQDAQFGRQYAGQQFDRRNQFQDQLLGLISGQNPLQAAGQLGQLGQANYNVAAGEQAQQTAGLQQFAQTIGYLTAKNRAGTSEQAAASTLPQTVALPSAPGAVNQANYLTGGAWDGRPKGYFG